MIKRVIIILAVLLAAVTAWGDQAKQLDFLLSGCVHPTTLKPLSGGWVKTYLDGTSTLSALWTDKDKGGVAANPFQLTDAGVAELYGDNIYKIEVFDEDMVLVKTIDGAEYKPVATSAPVNSISELEDIAFAPTDGQTITVTGYYSPGDGGGGEFYWDAASVDAPNAGTIIKVTSITTGRWIRLVEGGINVKWFGAKGDLSDNASPAIQATHDYIQSLGEPRVMYSPGGSYKCDDPITIDVSVVRWEADGALLDFTDMADGLTAITVTGGTLSYVGNPFFNGYSVISGLKIFGGIFGGSGSTKIGVDYKGTDNAITGAQSGMRDTLIWGFGTGLQISENSYILTFDNIRVFGNTTCVMQPAASNAGERIVFSNSAFYNSANGFSLQNSIASTFITNCSIDGMSDLYIYITSGHLTVTGCHFEGNFSGSSGGNPNARLFWNDDIQFPSFSYVTFSGCEILVKQAGTDVLRANPVFGLDGAIDFTMVGGRVFANDGAFVAAAVFGDDGSNGGGMSIDGTFVDNGANQIFSMTGAVFENSIIKLQNRQALALGRSQPMTGLGLSLPATAVPSTDVNTLDDYEEGAFNPVIEGTTTPGSATYSRQEGVYTKVGNTVYFWIDVVWSGGTGVGNLKVTGLPFVSSSLTMIKPCTINAYDVALTANNIAIATISLNASQIIISQLPTGGGPSTSVPYDAAGQLVISGFYFE